MPILSADERLGEADPQQLDLDTVVVRLKPGRSRQFGAKIMANSSMEPIDLHLGPTPRRDES